MEEIRIDISIVVSVYNEIVKLLESNNPTIGSATHAMLDDGAYGSEFAAEVLANDKFTDYEVKSVSGLHRSFGRHLSEVEQTVYEEIGEEQLNQLLALFDKAVAAYKKIWDYLHTVDSDNK